MPVLNFSDVNTQNNLNKGSYQAEITKWRRTTTQKNGIMITLNFKVSAPEQFRGTVVSNRYVIGEAGTGPCDSWGFPEDDTIDTTAFGTKQLVVAMEKAHISLGERELGEALDDLIGQEIIVYVENEEWDGKLRPAVKGHWALGEREPSVEEPVTANSPATVTRLSQRRMAPRAATVNS